MADTIFDSVWGESAVDSTDYSNEFWTWFMDEADLGTAVAANDFAGYVSTPGNERFAEATDAINALYSDPGSNASYFPTATATSPGQAQAISNGASAGYYTSASATAGQPGSQISAGYRSTPATPAAATAPRATPNYGGSNTYSGGSKVINTAALEAEAARKRTATGEVAAGEQNTAAINEATRLQLEGQAKMREEILAQFNPSVLAAAAKSQDIQRATDSLALQRQTDPGLAEVRQSSQQKLAGFIANLGNSQSDRLATQAGDLAEAGAKDPTQIALQDKYFKTANQELDLGTTLPADLQAELIQSGLQRAGSSLGRANGSGQARNINTQLFGTAALNLRAQRQAQAIQLGTAGSKLQESRLNLLASIFPALKQNQLANISGASAGFKVANDALPNAGLSGADMTNLMLSRLGALNQNTQDTAKLAATGVVSAGAAQAGVAAANAQLGTPTATPTTPVSYQSYLSRVGLTPTT